MRKTYQYDRKEDTGGRTERRGEATGSPANPEANIDARTDFDDYKVNQIYLSLA